MTNLDNEDGNYEPIIGTPLESGELPTRRSSDRVMENLVSKIDGFTTQAVSLSEDVRALNESRERDAEIIRNLERSNRRQSVALIVMGILAVVLLVGTFTLISVNSSIRQTADVLEDCLTPQGECNARLTTIESLQRNLTVKQVGQDRLADAIQAAKASAAAGSATAPATAAAYELEKKKIDQEILDLQGQLAEITPGIAENN